MHTDEGLLVSLDSEGVITKIHYNNVGLSEFTENTSKPDMQGMLFTSLFPEELLQKVISFLVEVRSKSASFGWELYLKGASPDNPLFFGGAVVENVTTIFGSRSKVNFTKFLSGMMVINNEQTERIRALEKDRVKSQTEKSKDNILLFDELTRLNNELVNMQRELSKKNMALAELNKIKNQFLGMAAHDLRNPLGNIMNYCEFLEEENDQFNEEQKEFVAAINSLSSFMLNLVNELLDVAAIEAGDIKLMTEKTDLIQLLNKVIYLNRLIADRKEIAINFKPSISSIPVNIDSSKIQQVITNLLTNAIKYSFQKTEIEIDVTVSGEEIIVSVKDHGQGIPADELKLLFRPFQKTSTKSTAGEKSIGLGLFIVKRIVEAHGGRIWAESELNAGSKFYFSIPL